ncbi:MAG: SIMPL domain-containing protein [Alphaproteobacteria bacterium]
MRALLYSLALITLAFTPALAAEETNAPKPGETILNLNATERQSMAQDTLVTSLRVEFNGKEAKDVQDQVNTVMAKAVAEAKKVEGVKVTTGGYYIYPFYPDPQNTKVSEWRASQSIGLEGKKADDVLKLSGRLQDMGFLMNAINYTLSSEKSDAIQDVLMERALKKVMDSAKLAAKALGKNKVELLEANVNGNVPYYPVMMRGMAADSGMAESKSVAPPVAEPGESEVTLSISARILLKP